MPTKRIVLSESVEVKDALKDSFFAREGFVLVPVADGPAGLEAVVAEAPALVILDLETLDEEAVTCCRQIKTDPLLEATPVMLVLPEGASRSQVDSCWACGADTVVERPIPAGQLLDSACSLLGISRRLARRFPVSFHLEYLDSTQKLHVGSAVNLNLGGMFLAAEQLFPLETRLLLEFTLPGLRTPLKCPVRVAWVNHPEWRKKNVLPCGMGVQFVDLSDVAKAAFREFLENIVVED
jgi:uncharacterized protein (TIGR02266 family)